MRIAQLTPGSGANFYCENCLRDVALVRAMRALGHDVLMIPMYLPVQGRSERQVATEPLFFGGVNVYLQQKLGLFRRTPRWLDRIWDSDRLLRWVGRMVGMTSARDLGEMTLSMLQGRDGRQVKELDRLVGWLCDKDNRPDVVVLSNVLLVGLAGALKEKLGVPVVCLLQDEDGFLDSLSLGYAEKAWDEVRRRSRDIDLFISVSKYFAGVMQERLAIAGDKMRVVYTGISLEDFRQEAGRPGVPAIGYLSRMCADRGLDTLVEAFIILKGDHRLSDVRLRIMGGQSVADKPFLDGIRRRLSGCGLTGDVEFLTDFAGESKFGFLRSLSVLSVPEKKPVAYGLYVLEALAAGVPVAQPDIGVFTELLEETGGGVLYNGDSAAELAEAIKPLLLDSDHARQLGKRGREAIFAKFNVAKNAEQMVAAFQEAKDSRGK